MSCHWFTIVEAAAFLKVHHTTLRRWIRQGKLEVYRPGGKDSDVIRVCLEELNKMGEKDD